MNIFPSKFIRWHIRPHPQILTHLHPSSASQYASVVFLLIFYDFQDSFQGHTANHLHSQNHLHPQSYHPLPTYLPHSSWPINQF